MWNFLPHFAFLGWYLNPHAMINGNHRAIAQFHHSKTLLSDSSDGTRHRNALIQISSDKYSSGSECGRHDGRLNALWTNITCSYLSSGRWVTITMLEENSINLLEIEVIGY